MSERPLGQDHSRWQEQRWERAGPSCQPVWPVQGAQGGRGTQGWRGVAGEPWTIPVFTPRTVGTSEGF